MSLNTLSRILVPNSGVLAASYRLRPAVTGVPAVGAVLTSGAGAWGALADIVAAAGIAADFFICGFYVNTLGVAQVFEVQVSNTTQAGAIVSEFRIDPTAITPNLGLLPVGAYPVFANANDQIQGRAGGAAAKTIGVSVLYTTG